MLYLSSFCDSYDVALLGLVELDDYFKEFIEEEAAVYLKEILFMEFSIAHVDFTIFLVRTDKGLQNGNLTS